ncbi:Transposase [Cardinium endosymbiont of Sogatella furcifera]|uniref:IS110 family transposase n=1 Tax=Cardinium endosymbiont of Sogatella furcifera TaxID=650378 RepID=UPI000E0D47E2|nr:transposase [Cardinium endosymbiont of Sogatella furcifera]AXI24085.1 Transposase [Cardinium endosymbiont of Sogatella furcifera]AXI24267.1 Transposase [Cardinium endosymbiont of Sogatella furcifera]AXI24453.1 Transposase [Cardinium endosymbiont of Sogatella furcifera]
MNRILGLDIGKTWLDACFYSQEAKSVYKRFRNDEQGHKELIDYLDQVAVKIIVCEPTGGYERAICEKLYAANVHIHQVNTYTFSSFSKSLDHCKTDKHDGVPRRPPF